ncbi:MAG: class I SAM-dependent methyltransferase, partial [Dysgonamonadaceae bacterium]|nr:class I SAM-dependent methyltransferase [Dysgonamonadaceae bacterium]
MDKTEVRQKARECIQLIRNIDFETLGISQYNLEYIRRMLPNLNYHFRIYTDSILILLKNEKIQPWFVDFGGGHGFLSLLLKMLGFKVIYCDNNPLSVQTITKLKSVLKIGPDHIVEGSSDEFLAFCTSNKIKPNYLIATDLIEHIYDLDIFFSNLYQINPGFKMVFTTYANPSNPQKVRILRKLMIDVEKNIFLPMREDFIRENYQNLTDKEFYILAKSTRGLTYKDIPDTVDNYLENAQLLPVDVDNYNTCDPQSGNWMERILPLKEYRKILNENGFHVEFKKGFYNENYKNPIKTIIYTGINKIIKYSGL